MGQEIFRQKYEIACDYQGEDDYDDATYAELMQLAHLELPDYAEEVLRTDTKDLYSDFQLDLEMSQWSESSFPVTTFTLLLAIIRDSRFLKTRNGWYFLMIFESEWEKVTEKQKAELLGVLSEIYEKFEDWMPCFSISELVGENFAPALAYDFSRRFENSLNETARSFTPHILEHALRNSPEAALEAQLWDALLKMAQDESPNVRGEVEESLFRLSNRGLQPPQ